MASRDRSHSFVILNMLTVFYHHPIPSLRRLPDGFDVRPFKSNPVPLASRTRCSSLLSSISHATCHPPLFRSTSQASLPPSLFFQKFGTRLRASFAGTFSARGFLYLHSIATHCDIALRRIFRIADLYLCGDLDNWNRTLDIFDRVKVDPLFSRRIKALRVHWSYDDGDIHVVRLVRINKGGKQTEAEVSKVRVRSHWEAYISC